MKNKKLLSDVLKYIGKYKFLLILSLLTAAISVCITLYVPILTGNAIDLINENGLTDFNAIKNILIKIATLVSVTAILQWIMGLFNNKITYNVTKDIRNEAFAKLEILPLKYLDSKSDGETLNRIISDADQFGDGLLMGFSQLFTGVITIGVTLVYMFTIDVRISLIVALLTPLSLFTAKFIASKTYRLFLKKSEINAQETGLIEETISGIKTVKAFSMEEKKQEEFDEINKELGKYSLKAVFFSSLTNPSTRFLNSTVYAIVASVGALLIVKGSAFTIGGLVAFLSYATQYTKPFNEISGVIAELQNSLACASRLFEFIKQEGEKKTEKNEHLTATQGNITLESVYFSYSPEKKLIEDFNLTVKKGQRVAIVGPTGCGKTTLINLLMRFYDVDSGKIVIDGTDINNVDKEEVRTNFGMVLQDTWLTSGTVKENIKFGKPEATDEEVIESAKKAHAHSFITRLPNGYDTVIGEGSGNLSQGQKQLLCIARIMLTQPTMLILDEATSSIDTRTEIKIQKAFSQIMKGRTSFIVAHRLSTIIDADIILVMNKGKIIEQGNHKQLMKQNGFYANMFNSQFK